ncbi:MAG: tetratricopeptide repeat protein [Archangium sp.]|nr:tetratricopeptide repeat protein [Archangium sp.]
MPNSDVSRWWIAAEVFLALSMVALPWSLGGAPDWSLWVLVVLGSAASIAWCGGAAKNHRRWGWHPVLLLPALVAVVAMLQLIPLPPALLGVLSPPAAELREYTLVPLGLTQWRPVTMDVPSTLRGLGRAVSLGMLLFVATELGRLAGVRRRLFKVLALSATATAVCGFVHLLAGLDALFGVVHFGGNVPFITPFGNTNHLAAWLLLGGTVALGLSLDSPTRDEALGWGLCAATCGVAVFLSYSRGGAASFIFTWLLVGAAALASKAGSVRRVLPWVLIGGTILGAGLLAFDDLVERADSLASVEKFSATKIALWPMLTHGVVQFPWLGMGVGAFELGFSRFHDHDLTVTFTHPENIVMQVVADLGVPGAVLLGAIAAWSAWLLWRRVRGAALERTAFLGLLGLVVHDVFDFSLELNAVPVAAAIVLGSLASLDEERGRQAVRAKGMFIAAAVSALAFFSVGFGLPHHLAAEAKLAEAITEKRPPADVRARGLALINRHPSDWVLYAQLAADVSGRSDPREALAWVNRLLFLRPRDARAHVAAARALLRLQAPMQALAELKLAWLYGDPTTLELGLSLAEKEGDWGRVLLERPGHLELAWAVLMQRGRPADARKLLQAALDFPPSQAVGEEAALLVVRHDAARGDPAEALRALEALPAGARTRVDLSGARAELLMKLGRTEEAITELEATLNREPQDVGLGFRLADLLTSLKQNNAAREVLQRIRPFAGTAALRSAVFQREAQLWLSEEKFPRALEALQTASRIEPVRPDLHYQLADLFERMGSLHSALDEIQRGRALDSPEGGKSREPQIKRIEAALGTTPL